MNDRNRHTPGGGALSTDAADVPNSQRATPSAPIRRRTEFEGRTLYRDMLACKRLARGPLSLSAEEFQAYRDHFVAAECGRHFARIRKNNERRADAAGHYRIPDEGPPLKSRRRALDLDIAELQRLVLVAWVSTAAEGNKAREKVLGMVRAALPPKRRPNRVLDDALKLVQYIARRHFVWTVLRGDHRAGRSIAQLRAQYFYLEDFRWDDAGRLNFSPQENALQDAAREFNIGADSLRSTLYGLRRSE